MKVGGRIAFREEGNHWNAYYALPDTMEGALWLGSLAMAFVNNKKQKKAFMALIKACVEDMFRSMPDGPEVKQWQNQEAPEHEKTKGKKH